MNSMDDYNLEEVNVLHICNRCNRSFNHKSSLVRHQKKRMRLCRPAEVICLNCSKGFASVLSLKKHAKLYCKLKQNNSLPLEEYINLFPDYNPNYSSSQERSPESSKLIQSNSLSLEDYIKQFPSYSPKCLSPQEKSPQSISFITDNCTQNQSDVNIEAENLQTPVHHQFTSKLDDIKDCVNPSYADSMQALFDEIKFSPFASSPNVKCDNPVPTKDNDILNHFDTILTTWLREVQRLEGTCRSDVVVKEDIYAILSRMLEDGLIFEQEYKDLVYTTDLFVKLSTLISIYIPALHKREIIELLVKLYDMSKINANLLVEFCLKL